MSKLGLDDADIVVRLQQMGNVRMTKGDAPPHIRHAVATIHADDSV